MTRPISETGTEAAEAAPGCTADSVAKLRLEPGQSALSYFSTNLTVVLVLPFLRGEAYSLHTRDAGPQRGWRT